MFFVSLKSRFTSFVGAVVNQVYTTVASSAIHTFNHALLPGKGFSVHEILKAFHDPYDVIALELGYIFVGKLVPKLVPVVYFSNDRFSCAKKAKAAMQFDLATAMTTCMPGMYQNPRNVYGIMSFYQQEKIDRQDYEFIDYSLELNKASVNHHQHQQVHAAPNKPKNCKRALGKFFHQLPLLQDRFIIFCVRTKCNLI